MPKPSNLDNPDYARFAWGRYWRLMRWMAAITGMAIVIALIILYAINGWVSIHLYIAAGLGIGVSMLLTAGLMGLVFLSSGTGHDDAIDDALADEEDL